MADKDRDLQAQVRFGADHVRGDKQVLYTEQLSGTDPCSGGWPQPVDRRCSGHEVASGSASATLAARGDHCARRRPGVESGTGQPGRGPWSSSGVLPVGWLYGGIAVVVVAMLLVGLLVDRRARQQGHPVK